MMTTTTMTTMRRGMGDGLKAGLFGMGGCGSFTLLEGGRGGIKSELDASSNPYFCENRSRR